MKRAVRVCLTLLLSILMTVSVWADAAGVRPDYKTDYYMVVESPDGGVNIYATPSLESTPLNSELIPNGTALHIEGEVADGSRVWGYTEYRGMKGYVPLDDCRMVSESEAIKSELAAAGQDNVDYDVNYEVEAGTSDMLLYKGPGEKYGVVDGSRLIEKGEKLQITQEANLLDGSSWGLTTVDGLQGWVNLERTKEWMEKDSQAEVVDMSPVEGDTTEIETENAAGNGTETETASAVAEAEATPTATPKPTATSTPTPEPTATSTPTPEPTSTSTPTPEPTETSTPTPEPTETSTPTPEPTATTEPTDAAEEADAQAEAAAATEVEEEGTSPLLWIAGIAILAIIILLLYHLVKRNK